MKSIKTIIRNIITGEKLGHFAYSCHTETAIVYEGSPLISLVCEALKTSVKVENATKLDSVRNVFRHIVPARCGLYFDVTARNGQKLYIYIPDLSLNDKHRKDLLNWAGYNLWRSDSLAGKPIYVLNKEEKPVMEWNDPNNIELYSESTALLYFFKKVFYSDID